jgi:hypothetical protein
VHADVAPASKDRSSQPGVGELRTGDHPYLGTRRRRALEYRRHRLDLLGRSGLAEVVAPWVGTPAERIDHADARQPERVTDEPVLAGTAAGTQRRQPGDGRGRETDLKGLAAKAGQHRRVLGVGVEQLGTQPVDEENACAGDVAGQREAAVETLHAHRRQHRWHHIREVRRAGIELG